MASFVGLKAERYGLTLNYQDEIINFPLKLRFPFTFYMNLVLDQETNLYLTSLNILVSYQDIVKHSRGLLLRGPSN